MQMNRLRYIAAFLLATVILLSADSSDKPTLEQIAREILLGLKRGDTSILLRFETSSTIRTRAMQLQSSTDPLFCYVFESRCADSETGSVKSHFEKWKKPSFFVDYSGNQPIVYFFDATQVDRRKLHSMEYRCQHAWKNLFSWTFSKSSRGWKTAALPFDSESDALCSPTD